MDSIREAVAITFTFGTLAGSVLYLVRSGLDHLRHSRSEKLQADLYTRLLDKFGSSQDLLAYLQTDAGRNILKPPVQEQPPAFPSARIMTAVQIGTVLIAIGLALLLIKAAIDSRELEEGLTVFGILGLMTGIGFLVSAFASWKLAEAWRGKEQ